MLANAFRHVFSPPCLMQQESEEQHYLAHGKETRNTPSKVTTIKTFLKCFRSGEYTAQRLPSTLALHQSSYVPLALPAAVLPAFPHNPHEKRAAGLGTTPPCCTSLLQNGASTAAEQESLLLDRTRAASARTKEASESCLRLAGCGEAAGCS